MPERVAKASLPAPPTIASIEESVTFKVDELFKVISLSLLPLIFEVLTTNDALSFKVKASVNPVTLATLFKVTSVLSFKVIPFMLL